MWRLSWAWVMAALAVGVGCAGAGEPAAPASAATAPAGQGPSTAPLGAAAYYPSAQRPIGWRGDGTGHYPSAQPPLKWGRSLEDGRYVTRNIRWMTRIPHGGVSLPVVVADRIFVTANNAAADGRGPLDLYCINAATGRVLWMRSHTQYDVTTAEDRKAPEVAALAGQVQKLHELDEQMVREINAGVSPQGTMSPPAPGLLKQREELAIQISDALRKYDKERFPVIGRGEWGFASPTPVSDGQRVYAYFTSMVAVAYDLDGKLQWIQRAPEAAQYKGYEHNFHASPVLVDGKFIVASAARVVALDARTGGVLWNVSFMTEGYAWLVHSARSLITAKVGGEDVVILPDAVGVRVRDGSVAFKGGIPHGFDGASTAVMDGDMRYEVTRGGVFAARLPAEIGGTWTVVKKYNSPDHNNWVERSCASQLYHDGLVYYVNHMGELRVYDMTTARLAYEQKLSLKPLAKLKAANPGVTASPTLAGGRIYVFDDQGNAVVFEPGPAYKELAQCGLVSTGEGKDSAQELTLSCPVFHGKCMYVRGQRFLYCIAEE